jgi:hypothetical protein
MMLKEGTLSLYKGMSQPLIGAVPANALVFITTDEAKAALNKWSPDMTSTR